MKDSKVKQAGMSAIFAVSALAAGIGGAKADKPCYDCGSNGCFVQDSWWDGVGLEDPCVSADEHGNYCHWDLGTGTGTMCWGY